MCGSMCRCLSICSSTVLPACVHCLQVAQLESELLSVQLERDLRAGEHKEAQAHCGRLGEQLRQMEVRGGREERG